MKVKFLCVLSVMVLTVAGCANTAQTGSEEITSETVLEEKDLDEDYVLPQNVTLSDTYDKSGLRVSLEQVVTEWYDESYKSMNIESHTLYQSATEGYDYEDWVIINVDCDNPSGMLSQQIQKVAKYARRAEDGVWEVRSAQTKKWIVNNDVPINLVRTYWSGHFENASDVNEKIFHDEEGNIFLPETEAGKGADMYVYFAGDFSFFYVSVNPNSENTREIEFYTEGSATLNYVYEGEVYRKEIHFIEGKLDDKGHAYIKPEDSEEYFEVVPLMNEISKEEYEAAVEKGENEET